MLIAYTDDGVGLFLTTTKVIVLTAAEKDALKAAGVPEVAPQTPMSDDFWRAAGAPDDVLIAG